MAIDYHSSLAQLVERAAVNTVNKWPSYLSVDDVEQEIWLWALQKQASVELAMKVEGWEAKVYSTMLKVASSAASKEDQEANGYSKDDTYIYSTDVIEVILESVFQYEDWQSFGLHGDGQPRAKGQVNETGDMIAMLSDVKAAIAELDIKRREILFFRYALQLKWEEVGERLGISFQAAERRAKTAVNALRDQLGRVNPADLRSGWENRRDALTNERAQLTTDRQYEG